MTRAKETLTLCEAIHRSNPFTLELEPAEYLLRTEPDTWLQPVPELAKRYQLLGFADVDLGFAGRLPSTHPVHAEIRALRISDRLQLVQADGRWTLRDRQGITVGRLAGKCQLRQGTRYAATVSAVITRHKRRSRLGEALPGRGVRDGAVQCGYRGMMGRFRPKRPVVIAEDRLFTNGSFSLRAWCKWLPGRLVPLASRTIHNTCSTPASSEI
ncbi:hypothetical protein ACW73L_16260 [Methylolobus aquaticus]